MNGSAWTAAGEQVGSDGSWQCARTSSAPVGVCAALLLVS